MGVVILGAHRGGTSALTRVVNLLGLQAGPPDRLIGATPDNVGGHWEVEALSSFDEDLLGHLGGRWSGPPLIDAAKLRELACGDWGERASAAFSTSLPDDGWVWKDPRACLLLPFWRAVLADDLVIVAGVRNPVESARSLEARDGLPVQYGMALWERYQRSAMFGAGALPVFVVSFDALLADPNDTWDRLGEFLSARGQPVDLEAGRQEALAFLDRGQRHHRMTGELHPDHGVTQQQADLYRALLEGTGEVSGTWGAGLPPESPALQLAFDEHQRLSRHRDLEEQLRTGLEETRTGYEAEIGRLWSEIKRLEAELGDALDGRRAVVEALERAIVSRDEWKAHAEWLSRRWPLRVRRWISQLVNGRTPD